MKAEAKRKEIEAENLRLKKQAEQEKKEEIAKQKRELAEKKRLEKEAKQIEAKRKRAEALKAEAKKKEIEAEKRRQKVAQDRETRAKLEKKLSIDKINKGAEFRVISKNNFSQEEESLKQENVEDDLRNQIINKKINEKILFEEKARKRNDEIKKRKFANYNETRKSEIQNENKKYFFDENIINKISEKENDFNVNDQTLLKKELKKKNLVKSENTKKEKNIITAFNAKKPLAKLKNKQFNEKTETFYFNETEVELDINQKIKITEYVDQIRNKPIKIEIKPNFNSINKLNKNSKRLAKSRSLLIRAYLVKLGISHNRIKILLEDKKSSVSINEVIINFIEL